MSSLIPIFNFTNQITVGLTRIERVRGFLEAATLSEDWVREMGNRALVLEAHHTTHIEGTRLTLEQAIRRDILTKEYSLSERQTKALGHILEHGSLTIQDFERLCPEVNRRSLQRDLKAMVDKRLLISEGATNKLVYRMKVTA
jgi:predicted HTH transcriptional regulator